jgi:hypothetical protein
MTDRSPYLADRWSVPPEQAWRLLTEPMDEKEARRAADAITAALPHVQALPIDPRENLVLAWDRRSVEMFREALLCIASADRPVPERIVRELDQWLQRAEPYGPDDEPWPST